MYTLSVNGNKNSVTPPIGPRHSTVALSLILPHTSQKSLKSKLFIIAIYQNVSRLLQANLHTPHVLTLATYTVKRKVEGQHI